MHTHTPGPWKTERRTFNYGWYGHEISTTEHSRRVLATPRRHSIAVIHSDDDEDRANARLISLAPELLKALEGMLSLRCVKAVENIHGEKAVQIKQARSLIARAKGGQSWHPDDDVEDPEVNGRHAGDISGD